MALSKRSPRPSHYDVDFIVQGWTNERPDLDVKALDVFGRLHRGFLAYRTKVNAVFEDFGVNEAAFDVLASLRRSGPEYTLTAGELAVMTLVTTGGLSLRARRLEESGLVVRHRDEVDARVVHVTLTDAGLELIDAVADVHFQNLTEMLHGLDEGQRAMLATLLTQLEESVSTSATVQGQ